MHYCLLFQYTKHWSHMYCGIICCFTMQFFIFIYSIMGLLISKYESFWQVSDTQVTVKASGTLVFSFWQLYPWPSRRSEPSVHSLIALTSQNRCMGQNLAVRALAFHKHNFVFTDTCKISSDIIGNTDSTWLFRTVESPALSVDEPVFSSFALLSFGFFFLFTPFFPIFLPFHFFILILFLDWPGELVSFNTCIFLKHIVQW